MIDFNEISNGELLFCGDNNTAQFGFYITNSGEICTIRRDEQINIIYSSFNVKFEQYALMNENFDWYYSNQYLQIENQLELENFMKDDFYILKECSDKYNLWWKNENLIVISSTWLDKASKYFRILSRTKEICDNFLIKIKPTNILKD